MSSPAQDQIAFVHKLSTDAHLRQAFLADPVKTSAGAHVTLDDDLRTSVQHTLGQIDRHAIDLAQKNPFGAGGGGQPVMNVVLEAAAVVAAAAAVVSAATAVYNSTKFRDVGNFDKAKLISGASQLGNQIGRIGAEVSANSHALGANQINRGGLFHP